MNVRSILLVGSIHLNCRSDPCHSFALCPWLPSMAWGSRSFIWSTVPCEIYLPLSRTLFLPLSFFLSRLQSILQLLKAHPYFRAFVPTGPSFRNSPLLQANPSHFFFLLHPLSFYLSPTHASSYSLDVISSGKCLLTQNLAPILFSITIFYFSCIALTKVVVE